ncbi:hypothetical protein O181_042306 [Austropuccinia psidii MF-1]|uniref:Reverse transcriptase RNase H-like domain-containing protein n=1 Tax=Austropuccinia psidii MF-1 TaxID=1389203 RepID=A0A9Q3DEM8_9BASI|nr:hypothetical protein [Austropuccinia psidii MF-1]
MEELWNEEEEPEEIETVIKVVPSSYRQYLDVFSKVNAEKLPPYHTCAHHIELEGSVPPAGEAFRQFHQLKEALTTAPIISHFKPYLPTIAETDAADYALGVVLTELNYEIYDKELLGIVWALKCWRAFLLSLSSSFEVLTDHSSLQL